MCLGKLGYPTQALALAAAGRRRHVALRNYQCPECSRWHLSKITTSLCGRCLQPMTGGRDDWQCATCADQGAG